MGREGLDVVLKRTKYSKALNRTESQWSGSVTEHNYSSKINARVMEGPIFKVNGYILDCGSYRGITP